MADESGTAHDSSPAHSSSSNDSDKAAVSSKHTKAAASSKHKAASSSTHGAAGDVKNLFGERVAATTPGNTHAKEHHDETDLSIQLRQLRREATAFAHQISAARYSHTMPLAMKSAHLSSTCLQ